MKMRTGDENIEPFNCKRVEKAFHGINYIFHKIKGMKYIQMSSLLTIHSKLDSKASNVSIL